MASVLYRKFRTLQILRCKSRPSKTFQMEKSMKNLKKNDEIFSLPHLIAEFAMPILLDLCDYHMDSI